MRDVTTLDWFAAQALITARGGLPCESAEQKDLAMVCYDMAEKMVEEKKRRELAAEAMRVGK